MLLNMLVQVINNVVKDIKEDDIRITVGCLLYSYLDNQADQMDLRNKALSFKEYYYSMCIDKKRVNRTVGYRNIETIIINKKYKNLSSVTDSDYEKILKAFNIQILETGFDINHFDARTFGKISFSSNQEKDKYGYLHREILKPISSYYYNKYKIKYNYLKIVDIPETVEPAREIKFFIQDYPSDRIVQDILMGIILFSKKPSVVKLTTDSLVHVII